MGIVSEMRQGGVFCSFLRPFFHKRGKYDIVWESDSRYCTGASQENNVLYSSCQGEKAAIAGFPPLPKNYTRTATRDGAGG